MIVIAIEGLIGAGKCLAPNTPIAMFDGTIKTAKEITVGDLILGDDSKPRKILSTCRGKEEMYRIVPKRGDTFEVNKPHILTLRCPHNPLLQKGKNRSKTFSRYRVQWFDKDGLHSKSFTFSVLGKDEALKQAQKLKEDHLQKIDTFDISVETFLSRSKVWQQNCQLFHVGFDWKEQKVPLDPYIYGLWLGDGHSGRSMFTNGDIEVIQEIKQFAIDNNLSYVRCDTISHRVGGKRGVKGSNFLIDALRNLGCYTNKHINPLYLTNSRAIRLQLLAGLIDSDGYLSNGVNYEIIQKRKPLAENIAYLSRSLGYMTSFREVTKNCVNNGKKGVYYKVTFWGDTLHEIPVKIPRKKAKTRTSRVTPNISAFSVINLGIGPYCGFTIDGNGRFLLGDFTVTHNTTLIHRCLLPILLERGWKVTIVDEPVSKWESDKLLKKFYENPERYAYHFQTKAFHDRVRECQSQFKKHKDDTDVFILERSVFSDTIFMNTLHDLGTVDDMEMEHYKEWWELWEEVMPFRPDMFIYLKPNLDVCMGRVRERARDGEEGVRKDYQVLLEQRHDEFFKGDAVEVAKGHYVPVLPLVTNSNFRDDPKVKEWITDIIEEKIKVIRKSQLEKK